MLGMSKETKRELIKRALIAATAGVAADDLERGQSLIVRSGLRAGDGGDGGADGGGGGVRQPIFFKRDPPPSV
jgi:hypothetical protein